MSGGWLAQRERGSRSAMRALVWVTLSLGRRAGRAFLYPICAYFVLFSRGARHASTDYLRRVLGRPPRLAEIVRHYHAYASTIHDRVYLRAGRYASFDVRVDAPPALLADLRKGGGCILLGSHLGSFEILRAAGLAEGAPPVSMLMHVEGGEKINRVLDAVDAAAAPRVIPLGRPGSLLRAQECLERGEIVGMLADRGLREDRDCSCQFLGAPARFPLGPLLLAGLLQAPVILAFGLYRGGRRYEVRLEPFAERIELDRRDRESSLKPWVERYAARLEHHCRDAPYNWFNFYDFWAPGPRRTSAPPRAESSRVHAKRH
ncbi:MAG: acyl-CoA synthetase [Burkholderiales bacterium]